MFRTTLVVILFLSLSSTSSLQADWPQSATTNLPIADRNGEQTQPKIRTLPDGGAYISWFDNATGGYDVYLQRLNAAGHEQWPHNGVLLADRGFSSTQDYDLDIDVTGNALLTFRDDRSGGTQITATKVSPTGVQLWGPTGVQLTTGNDFVAAPKISGTTDGDVVVAWKSNNEVKLQRLSPNGTILWGTGLTIPAIGGTTTSAADMNTSDNGSIIISLVRGFLSPNHLHAQKFDAEGSPMWGDTPPAIFDGGALQIANFPQFVSDQNGGAAFAWYSVSPLQVHTQHILADGTEQFSHNGVTVSMFARPRTAPDVMFDSNSGDTYVFWREEAGGPFPEFGVYGQRISSSGERLWSANGTTIAPLTTTELGQVRTVHRHNGAMVFWVETLSFGNQRIHAVRVGADGLPVWKSNSELVSSVASSKSRLMASTGPAGSSVLIWADGRNDANDVFAQTVNHDGTLGGHPADLDNNDDVSLFDIAIWNDCATGPNQPLDTQCASADYDNDGDKDWNDFSLLQILFNQ